MFGNTGPWWQSYRNTTVICCILEFKCHVKLLQYLSLPPSTNVVNVFTLVIYCLPMVITAVILFYNTERQQYHGVATNYCGKYFYNIGCWSVCSGNPQERERLSTVDLLVLLTSSEKLLFILAPYFSYLQNNLS